MSIAKAWTGEACRRMLSLSHQIHGAIGFTRELDLELYIRRAKMAEVAFGNVDFHRKKIAWAVINSRDLGNSGDALSKPGAGKD
ncbi:MAG: acyl-CoA dehydrogenase family protein [Chloroflexi bacterium]|nr:acyl-CoA dehydrogenase family protein [Chloroflexota bacterium]